MNRYTIEHDGRRFVVEADSEEQALGLVQGAAPVEQMVAGTPQQMAQQRAANMQSQLGLDAPVAAGESVPLTTRIKMGMAPTAEERQAAAEATYGKDSFLPISSNRALVKVPDGNGGSKWVIDNPGGMDVGDVAEMATNAPQIVAGALAAAKFLPGPGGSTARLAASSGAGAVASNIVGAAQDALYRVLTNTPVQPAEIAQRRGLSAGLEFLGGMVAGRGAEMIGERLGAYRAASKAVKEFIKEGEEAKRRLSGAGVAPATVAELGDAVRASNPINMTTAEAGETVAKVISDMDQRLLKASGGLAQRAAGNLDARAGAAIGAATTAKPVTAPEAGLAAIGAAKQRIADAQKAIDGLYDTAYKQIDADAAASDVGKFFVSLENTGSALKEMKSKLPRTDEGDVAGAFAPMLRQITELEKMTNVGQKLEAMRNVRTMLGERIKGKGGIFGDMQESVAKRLYGAISQDIDQSIDSFSGQGGALLKQANKAYKDMVQPVESSSFLDNLVNDGFRNPEDVVKYLSGGGTADWVAAKQMLPAPVYDQVRRAVVDDLMGAAKVDIAGREVADIAKLNGALSKMAPEVKDALFGNRNYWQGIEGLAKEMDFLKSKGGLFTSQALPSMNELREVEALMKAGKFDDANSFIKRAMLAAQSRRNNLSNSLVSQIKNGNYQHVTERPEDFFDSFILSGRHGPEYVQTVMKRLPDDAREQVAKVGFQRLFEKVRDTSQSVVTGGKGRYDVEPMLRNVLGSYRQQRVVEEVIGRERMDLIKDWARVEIATQIKNQKASVQGKRVAGLLATMPYPNLFAARAASLALEKASGKAFMAKAGPDSIEMFHQARVLSRNPNLTGAGLATVQAAMRNPSYGDYMGMMQDFTPEQQDAIDQYLLGE